MTAAGDASAGRLMTSPAVCIAAAATVWDAFQLMAARGVRHLVVLEQDRVVGILDDRALIATFRPLERVGAFAPVRTLLRSRSSCVLPDCDAAVVARVMTENAVDAVAVVADDGLLLGIVTATDLVRAIADTDAAGRSERPAGARDT